MKNTPCKGCKYLDGHECKIKKAIKDPRPKGFWEHFEIEYFQFHKDDCDYPNDKRPEFCEWYEKGDHFRRLAFMQG